MRRKKGMRIHKNLATADNDWVQRNTRKLQRYAGQWIAVTNHGVIASSTDFNQVYERARNKGIESPLVFKVSIPSKRRKAVSARSQ